MRIKYINEVKFFMNKQLYKTTHLHIDIFIFSFIICEMILVC